MAESRLRTPTNNPFVPGSDHIPEVWAGRADELGDWSMKVRARRLAGVYERGRALLGPPGVGKSVLVNRIAREAEFAGDLVPRTLRVPQATDVFGQLAALLTDLIDQQGIGEAIGRRATGLLARVRTIANPVIGRVNLAAAELTSDPHRDLTALLIELGRLARDREAVLLLRIDEIQNVRHANVLSQLLIALGDALAHEETVHDGAGNRHRRVLPIAVYLTGLSDFTNRTAAAGATFARRFRPMHLDPLDDVEVRQALTVFHGEGWPILTDDGPARIYMDQPASDFIIDAARGEPLLLQLAGEAAWNAGTNATIDRDQAVRGWASATREATDHVRRHLDRLTDLERDVIEALAQLPPDERTATAVAEALGRDSAREIASTLGRLDQTKSLIERGRPITFRHRAVEGLLTGNWPP